MDEECYRRSFGKLTGVEPYNYQLAVARLLFEGRNVILEAPTGAGKTWAALVPFFCDGWTNRPARVIYALPLRTLAQGVYREASELACAAGACMYDGTGDGHQGSAPLVTLQTGEQPDDPFFDRGQIIVTTYDQLLSGLLCGPYSLPRALDNINGACVAGALVVFDEFHLMPPGKAFLTAIAALKTFEGLCQSAWMTATATSPLEAILRSALDAVPVPQDDAAASEMLNAVPSVSSVTRTLSFEGVELSAERVLQRHARRSIALTNTVGRAQKLFAELKQRLGQRSEPELILLHSRFFADDRRKKEDRLQALFGRQPQGSAILVATQVVEAGIDISCEHLHTELCPMNSLVQRAGRCARFPGETGVMHVYELPPQRGWLPYGDLQGPDPTIDATRKLVAANAAAKLDPVLARQWVDEVHRKGDELAIRSLVKCRKNELLKAIHRSAVQRRPTGIAHLLRGDNSESIRVIICDEPGLPASPGKLESIALTRWSLAPHLDDPAFLGWYWDGDEQSPWKPLGSRDELALTYVVGVDPRCAAYDSDTGLRLGRPGKQQSQEREEPKRPGHRPYKEELWVKHARMVADAALERLKRDGFPNGLVSRGFWQMYGLNGEHIQLAARACGLLHDLGKLQVQWQEWARAWQLSRRPGYQFTAPLAHTDFNPDNEEDRLRQRSLPVRRPPHAAASAYYALAFLETLLHGVSDGVLAEVASACGAAIIAHHGAFLPKSGGIDLGVLDMSKGWKQVVAQCTGCAPAPDVLQGLGRQRDRRSTLERLLNQATHPDKLDKWWPLVAYLMRALRLSDQRATSQWTSNE
jgi:CRISPR-associated endonuclease/helicase Cas3